MTVYLPQDIEDYKQCLPLRVYLGKGLQAFDTRKKCLHGNRTNSKPDR